VNPELKKLYVMMLGKSTHNSYEATARSTPGEFLSLDKVGKSSIIHFVDIHVRAKWEDAAGQKAAGEWLISLGDHSES
jgi:hypothetical protein